MRLATLAGTVALAVLLGLAWQALYEGAGSIVVTNIITILGYIIVASIGVILSQTIWPSSNRRKIAAASEVVQMHFCNELTRTSALRPLRHSYIADYGDVLLISDMLPSSVLSDQSARLDKTARGLVREYEIALRRQKLRSTTVELFEDAPEQEFRKGSSVRTAMAVN